MSARPPSVVVLTGAGLSADSGLPTFRGADGLWEGEALEDVATPEAWRRDPARVWRFYQMRRAGLAAAQPNAAHHALAQLERELGERGAGCTLVTQNVDGLHARAGSRALEMHGSLARLRCEGCGAVVEDRASLDPARFVPCAHCGHARLRPDVVWFGEVPFHLDAIQRAVLGATRFLAAGTSGLVYPAAGLLALARELGAETWVHSLEPPDNLHPADRFVPGRAAEVVPRIVAEWLAE